MVMLRPKRFAAFLPKQTRQGQDAKMPSSKAVTPKEFVKKQSEARRSGLDWSTFTR